MSDEGYFERAFNDFLLGCDEQQIESKRAVAEAVYTREMQQARSTQDMLDADTKFFGAMKAYERAMCRISGSRAAFNEPPKLVTNPRLSRAIKSTQSPRLTRHYKWSRNAA